MKLEHLAKQFVVRTSVWTAFCTLMGGEFTVAVRAAPCGPVAIAVSGTNAVLTWSGSCALQESASATGPWSSVAGAASPFTAPVASGANFYRTLDPNGVCSPNVVAYVAQSVPAGPSGSLQCLVATPLNRGNNDLNTILPLSDAYVGTTVQRYNVTTQSAETNRFQGTAVGWVPNSTINPGEGFFIVPMGPGPSLTIVWAGEVPQGSLSNPLPPNGFAMRSSMVPQPGLLQSQLGFPAEPGDTVYLWNCASQQYILYRYNNLTLIWTPTEPPIPLATGFFLLRESGANRPWARTFVISDCAGSSAADALFVTVTNTTGQAASAVEVVFVGANGDVYADPDSVVAIGSPVPTVPSNGAVTNTVVIRWDTTQVAPDAALVFLVRSSNGPLSVAGGVWRSGSTNLGAVAGAAAARPPAPASAFGAIKIQSRCVPLGAPAYTPWQRINDQFGLQQCYARFCCVPGMKYWFRLLYCPFPDRFGRFVEGPCVPITPWLPDGATAARWGWQVKWQKPPPHRGPPPQKPPNQGGQPQDPWHWGMDVRFLNQNLDVQPGADFASAFFAMSAALEIMGNPNDPPPTFSQNLQRMAPGYTQAATALSPLLAEMDAVLAGQTNLALQAMRGDVQTLQDALAQHGSNFVFGLISTQALSQAAGALRNMATQITALPSPRFAHAADNLNVMAGAFEDALNSAPLVDTSEYDRQLFTWALYDRFRLMLEHFANATLPHLRVRVALSNWVWVPFTLEDVHVKIADGTTGELLDEQIVPFSDRSEFDVGLMNVASGRTLRIWFKLGSHLSRVINTTAQDGQLIGPLALTPGDANGDNCINAADRLMVVGDQGAGGLDATNVPSSDVNGDGVVDQADLQIVDANLGKCGEELRPPLRITGLNRIGSSVAVEWTGGGGPFVLQMKTALSLLNWMDLATTANNAVEVDVSGVIGSEAGGFFRIANSNPASEPERKTSKGPCDDARLLAVGKPKYTDLKNEGDCVLAIVCIDAAGNEIAGSDVILSSSDPPLDSYDASVFPACVRVRIRCGGVDTHECILTYKRAAP